MVLEESFVGTLDCQKDEQVGHRSNQAYGGENVANEDQIKPELSLEAIMMKLRLWAHHDKVEFSGKDNNVEESRRQQEKKKTKYEMD